MIHYTSGDILQSRAEIIAHGVAPNDHFDTGLALSLRERWPAMHKDFRHFCHDANPQPGSLWAWAGADGRRIVNLLTQQPPPRHGDGHPGPATLQHVGHALGALRKFMEQEKPGSAALPRLATGVGGLDWQEVRSLVEKHLGDLDIPVYVYETYKPGQAAAEPPVK